MTLTSNSQQHQSRIRYGKAAPEAYKAMRELQGFIDKLELPRRLVELVKIRASQLNGCAYCIDRHTKDAIALGEDKQRISTLAAWQETSLYAPGERAALEWTEALTLVSRDRVPQEVYERVHREFEEKELVELSMVIIAINAWNRLIIAFRHPPPGSYESSSSD